MQEHDKTLAAAWRAIARGYTDAAAILDGPAPGPDPAGVIAEFGDRGLTREEASLAFRSHGYAPQTSGAWARAGWLETRADGLRYITETGRELAH